MVFASIGGHASSAFIFASMSSVKFYPSRAVSTLEIINATSTS